MGMKKKDAGSGKGGKNMEKKMAMMRKVLSCLVIINLLIAVSMGSIQAQNISNTVKNLYFEVETIVNLKEDGGAHIFETISSEQQNIANINTDSIKSQALYNLEKQGYSVSNFDCDVENSDQRISIKASYDIQNYATDINGIWSVKPSTTDIYNVIGSYGYYLDIPFDLNIQSKMKFILPERSNVIYSGQSTINKNFGRSDVSLSRKVTTEGGREVILTEGDSRFIKGDIIDMNKFVELAKLIEFRYEIVQTISNESYIKNINYKKDLSANDFNYQSNNTMQLNVTTYAIQTLTQASESSTLSNDKIKLILYDDGNFRMERADGADLLFPSDTSAITIRIDSTDYAHNGGQYLGNYISTPLTIIDKSHAMIEYSFLGGDLDLRLDYFLAEGTVKFKVDVTNNDNQNHDVKVRFLFDTQLGLNDGAPLYSSVTGVRTYETEIEQQVSLWRAYDQWPDETVTGVGTIATSYDCLVFAWWPSAIDSTYDYTPDPNQRFYTPGYTTSPESDSCVLLYWDMGLISPSGSVDAITYYGTEEASFSNDIELLISKTETLKDELKNEINNDNARYDGVSCLADMSWDALHATQLTVLHWIKLGGDVFMCTAGAYHMLQTVNSGAAANYANYAKLWAEEGAWFTGVASTGVGYGDMVLSEMIHNRIKAEFDAHDNNKDEFHDNVAEELKDVYTYTPPGFPSVNDKTVNQVFSAMDSRQSEFESYARSNIPSADDFDYPTAISLIDTQIDTIQELRTKNPDKVEYLDVLGRGVSYRLGPMRASKHLVSEFADNIRRHDELDTALFCTAVFLFALGCIATGGAFVVVCIAATLVSGTRLANTLAEASNQEQLAAVWHSSFGELVSMKRCYPDALDANLDWLTDQIIDWKSDQIEGEVTYFSMPSEIVLGANEDYGTGTGTITVKNTGSLPCEVSASTPIFRSRLGSDWIAFLLSFYITIPYPQEPYEPYILDPGHEQTISFEFTLPRNTIDGMPYSAYTGISLDEKQIDLKVTDIYVGTQEEIDQMRLDNTQTIIDTYISTGQTVSEDVSISDSTEIAQFSAIYPGSDMDLHVYDTVGNHVGMNYDTGYVELEIAGAQYSGAGERPEWIVIPDAGGNIYTVEIVGVDVTIPEQVVVRTTEIPQRPGIMVINPKNIEMTLDENLINRLAIMLKESGGQNDLNDVTISVDGEVAPWIEFSFTDIGDIAAGDSVIVGATVNIPSNAVAGEYTGIIHVTGVDSSTGEGLRDDVSIILSVRGPSGQKIIYVDDDFTDDPANHRWNTIQEGINDASSGDTIIVRDGIYTENIDVNKPHLTIRSENGSASTIVQAANSNDHVFEVTEDHVNISGFTVKQVRSPSGYASGIVLTGVKYCEISENNIDFSSHGIALVNSEYNILKDNTVKNTATGISLRDSCNYNMVRNNTLEMNNYGIYLYNFQYDIGSDENTITCNKIINNYYYGINLRQSNSNIIYLNDFINNAGNAYSEHSTNIWNSPSKITYTYNGETYENYMGNYWSDYSGSDVNDDGIGDTAYNINSDKNNYPLMRHWENYFGVYKPGLKITVTSDKEEYPPGDYVIITMKFKNEGEEPVLIANPITTTFIASDGSIVLEEELSYSISVTLGAGGQWSLGTSYKLPDDAPEGYYDVKVSISGGKYVKTAENLFYVKAGSVPRDVTGEGRVDYKDLVGVIEHWGAIDTKYDVDRSGTVGYSDVKFILDHWTASKPYGRATTTVKGPVTVPLGSSFKVQITTDGTVEAAHINVISPSELKIESINPNPYDNFDFTNYQNGTNWVDVIVANDVAYGNPSVAPALAEIVFTATEKGTYTIYLSSVINGEANDVEALTVEVEAESIDTTPPVVISVEQSNDFPEQGEDVTITAHATDNVSVTSVTLGYDATELAMTLDSGSEKDGYWSATIPGQPACTTLSISVTASDAAGNTAAFGPHEKHWVDTIAPTISNVKVSQTYAFPGDSIYISAKVFDSSGVRWVRAYINKDGELAGTVFLSNPDEDEVYTGTWQTMNFTESGTYNIDISATDTEGNEALAKGPEIEIA